ncbi:MAG: HEPN domain-containing protein [Candidatus Cloacimonetes bacterium]|nr:HEPN domain-containing protein [Candidatus Cloacimonadota bacterium]MBL7086654.1 HEPN domain-containing protein [Candidatus Cloacimonadota bacterium]
MTKEEHIEYWLETAGEDWKTANHLFEKGDYSWCLFLCHLVLEKYLKALYVQNVDKSVPYKQQLSIIAKKAKLHLTNNQIDFLDEVTEFNIETRYSDYKKRFREKATKTFTLNYIQKIKEFKKWLRTLIKI